MSKLLTGVSIKCSDRAMAHSSQKRASQGLSVLGLKVKLGLIALGLSCGIAGAAEAVPFQLSQDTWLSANGASPEHTGPTALNTTNDSISWCAGDYCAFNSSDDRFTLLQFNIPNSYAGSSVVSATLEIRLAALAIHGNLVGGGETFGVRVYRIDGQPWDATGETFNSFFSRCTSDLGSAARFPSPHENQVINPQDVDEACGATQVAAQDIVWASGPTSNSIILDAAQIQPWFTDPSTNHGLLIAMDSYQRSATMFGGGDPNFPDYAPLLLVDLREQAAPAPGALALMCFGLVGIRAARRRSSC